MAGLRIVVVEDNAQISALLAELLEALGHQICATTVTEAEAVAAAALHRPDLMIVDVTLRTGNGVSAMEAIRARTTMPHIFMTADARMAFPAGAIVLRKPFGRDQLLAMLDRVAGRK